MVEQRRGVVRDAFHRQDAVRRRRAPEAAAVETHGLVGGFERCRLLVPHHEAEREGVQEEDGGALAPHVVLEVAAGDLHLHANSPSPRYLRVAASTSRSARRAERASSPQ